MNTKELYAALEMLEREKGIPQAYMMEKISAALQSAYKKEIGPTCVTRVDFDIEKKKMKTYVIKTVVDEVTDKNTQISLADAKEISKRAVIGGTVDIEVKPETVRRLSAIAAKSVIVQGIREGEKLAVSAAYENRREELISAVVLSVDPQTGDALLELERGEVVLPRDAQIPDEELREGDRILVYLTELSKSVKEPTITVSRTHPKMVWRLFELEVPEIQQGIVSIRSIAREPGSRTKISVMSRDPDVDPVGALIGPQNMRIDNVINEIAGEKIDIIRYSDVPEEYIAEALQPATVKSVTPLSDRERSVRVTVDPDQFSLAIGRQGQNVRLAAKLTGYKIDIKDR